MDKLGRNYELYIQTQTGDTLRITLPFTIEFDISRKLLGSANHASFRIFNLDKNNRNDIRFNMFNYSEFRSVKLFAGYGSSLSLVFSGNIHEAWSVREGVNFISQIESFDVGTAFVNSPFGQTFPAGTNQTTVLKTIAGSMPNVSVGAISNSYSATLTRANTISGNAADLIQDITGKVGGFFIDNGKVNCLQNAECLEGDVQIISADSGLLNTPLLQGTLLTFDLIFEPRIIVGQLVKLESITDPNFNGFYKVTSVEHRGMISAAVCGEAITSVGCLTGVGQLTVVAA